MATSPSLPTLDPKLFIYLAATDQKFKNKYFADPDALAHDYKISPEDLAAIKRVDFSALNKDLLGIEKDIRHQLVIRPDDTCHSNGHSSSLGTGHSNATHSNTCPKDMVAMLHKEFTKVTKS